MCFCIFIWMIILSLKISFFGDFNRSFFNWLFHMTFVGLIGPLFKSFSKNNQNYANEQSDYSENTIWPNFIIINYNALWMTSVWNWLTLTVAVGLCYAEWTTYFFVIILNFILTVGQILGRWSSQRPLVNIWPACVRVK